MPPPLPKTPQAPTRKPHLKPAAVPRIDASSVAKVNVGAPQATRLTIQITGSARVGEELEIFVLAQSENGELDQTFNELVQIACDRPLAGLGPLQFANGTARLRVRCLTQGIHEFSLIFGQSGVREFAGRPDVTHLENQHGMIH